MWQDVFNIDALFEVEELSEKASEQEVSVACELRQLTEKRMRNLDREILRGISLSKSLCSCGSIWRQNPMKRSVEERQQTYSKSYPVDSLDVFISHSWLSDGSWKCFSLLLQSRSQNALLFWLCGVALAVLLCLLDLLPMAFNYKADLSNFEEDCALGPWAMTFGLGATLLGFTCPTWRSPICFIDVACINQLDENLMRRGGIFTRASSGQVSTASLASCKCHASCGSFGAPRAMAHLVAALCCRC